MHIVIERQSEVARGYLSERARGLFNVSEQDGSSFRLEADLPLELEGWQVGVVVGSSGSGKSSIGDELAAQGYKIWTGGKWSRTKPILEDVPGKSFDVVTGVLSQVGLGSVPAWLRPYAVLSNGEKFRADCVKLLQSKYQEVVIDEFTSVLDRQVAQVGAGAFVRAWRKRGGRLIALTCHHDVLDWMQPDWVFDTDRQKLFVDQDDKLGAMIEERAQSDFPEVGRLVIQR